MLNINKYLSSPALSSERSITDSSILSTGNVTLSTITKLDTQNTLQTSEGNVLSSDASIKNTTISKPSTGNTTSKTTDVYKRQVFTTSYILFFFFSL